jgi:RimJ/RimL family protein N-acetyltransferase
MLGLTYNGNIGSLRVMEKCGFHFREEIKDYKKVRDVLRDGLVLDWDSKAV